MSKIKDHYLSLCRMEKYLRSGDANFIDLVHFMNRHNICYKPGCTTCCCMALRHFLREDLGNEVIAKMLNSVTREQILDQFGFDWHDAMEVVLVDNSSELFKDSFIYKAYIYVWDEYWRLRYREHLRPWGARRTILEQFQSFDPQPR